MIDNPENDSAQCFYDKTNILITTSVTNSLAYSFKSRSSFTQLVSVLKLDFLLILMLATYV